MLPPPMHLVLCVHVSADIGSENTGDNPLVCNTTNVNMNCCRTMDGGSRGEWYLPDGTRINNTQDTSFQKILAFICLKRTRSLA